MEKWSLDNIPDQHGRIALVTGANSGLGLQISLALASKGAEVILACRNSDSATEAVRTILDRYPDAKLHTVGLDLADLNSVAQCIGEVRERYSHIDLLINNAGIMVPPLSRTKQGFELQFGTNHIGQFALTGGLLPMMRDVTGSRVVSVSSIAALMNYIDMDDLSWEYKRYRKWAAYAQSKLANQMFILELAEKLEKSGSKTIAAVAHPGVSSTSLFKTSGSFINKIGLPIVSQTPDKGALPILRAACDPEVQNGSYWGPSGLLGFKGSPVKANFAMKAKRRGLREQLWSASEKMIEIGDRSRF